MCIKIPLLILMPLSLQTLKFHYFNVKQSSLPYFNAKNLIHIKISIF